MSVIFTFLFKLLTVLITLVIAYESPGDGPAKKAAVTAALPKALLDAGVPIPGWATDLVVWLVGYLIDLIVAWANKNGWFSKS